MVLLRLHLYETIPVIAASFRESEGSALVAIRVIGLDSGRICALMWLDGTALRPPPEGEKGERGTEFFISVLPKRSLVINLLSPCDPWLPGRPSPQTWDIDSRFVLVSTSNVWRHSGYLLGCVPVWTIYIHIYNIYSLFKHHWALPCEVHYRL